jgi:Overcoming lysogenization defect protein-like, TOPRIM domain
VELLSDIRDADVRAAVLVEGTSDVLAVRAVAEQRGLDLEGLRVALVPMGGATNARRHVELFGPGGRGIRLAGLYDAAQEPVLRRALAGLGPPSGPGGLEALGFFGCTPDLEHELIRALGIPGVVRVIADEGELASLRLLQRQPAQRNRTPTEHLHRFLGVRSGRKARYAWLLARALEPDQVPRPLARLVDHVLTILDGR